MKRFQGLCFIAGWLLCLSTFSSAITLNEALDNDALIFTTGGTVPWTIVDVGNGDWAKVGFSGSNSAWVETKVTGPGRLSFRSDRGDEIVPLGLGLTFSVDGNVREIRPDEIGISFADVSTGPHTVRWSVMGGQSLFSFFFGGRLDEVTWEPIVTMPLVPTTPVAGLTLTTSTTHPWTNMSPPDRDGGGALVSDLDLSSSSWLEGAVTGPSEVEFWAQGGASEPFLGSSFSVTVGETSPVGLYVTPDTWRRYRFYVPSAAATIRWNSRPDWWSSYGIGWWIDSIKVSPAVSLEEALDAPGLTWSTSVEQPAYGVYRDSHDGVDAAVIGTFVSTVLAGPAVFSIQVKSDDSLPEVKLANTLISANWSTPQNGWVTGSLPVPPGAHRLTITHLSGGNMLDEASLVPVGAGTIADGLHSPGRVWTTSPAHPWAYSPVPGGGQNDSIALTLPEGPGKSWLETTVTGPGMAHFAWRGRPYQVNTLFRVNGRVVDQMDYYPSGYGWQDLWYVLPAGTHTLRWETDKATSESRLAGEMSGFTWIEGNLLPELLESGDRVFIRTSSPAEPLRETADTISGGDAFRLPGDASSTGLQTFIEGPGRLKFWWKSPSGSSPTMQFFGKDNAFKRDAPEGQWRQETVDFPPGFHRVAWVDSMPDGLLDKVEYTPSPATTLAAALDSSGLTWTTGVENPWRAVHDAVTGDDYAAAGYADQPSFLSTTVSGSGWLTYRQDPGMPDNVMDSIGVQFDDNGTPRFSLAFRPGENSILLPPSTHTLTWQYRSGFVGLPRLDHVAFTSLPKVSAGKATETGSRVWRTSAAAPWTGYEVPEDLAAQGNDALLAAWARDTVSWAETDVTGPGLLDFSVAGQVPANGKWQVLLDRLELPPPPPSSPGTFVGSGLHTLRWTFRADTQPANLFGLDNVSWKADDTRSLAAALDSPLTFATGGTRPWTGTSLRNQDGTDSAVSAALATGESAWLQTSVTGPATVSFEWNLTYVPPSGSPSLELMVDGASVATAPAGMDADQLIWQKRHISLPAGVHVLRWVHTGADSGNPAGWVKVHPNSVALVDRVLVTPGGITAALDFSAPAIAEGNVTTVTGAAAHDGADAVSLAGSGDSLTKLAIPLSGPGLLRFWWKSDGQSGLSLSAVLPGGVVYSKSFPANDSGWQEAIVPVPVSDGGRAPALVAFQASEPGSGILLDEMSFTSTGPAVSLHMAMDAPGIQWSDPSGLWAGIASRSHDGSDAAWSALAKGTGPAKLSTILHGAGTLRFQAMQAGGGTLEIRIDGQALPGFAAHDVWELHSITLGPGEHSMEFTHTFGSGALSEAMVDEFQWTSEPGLAIAAATDAPELAWPEATSTWWQPIGYAGLGATGGHAMMITSRSDAFPPGRSDELKLTLTGPGILRFRWRGINMNSNGGFVVVIGGPFSTTPALRCSVDGTGLKQVGNSPPWQSSWSDGFIYVPPGPRTVSWAMRRGPVWIPGVVTGETQSGIAGLVDAVQFQPVSQAYGEWAASHMVEIPLPPVINLSTLRPPAIYRQSPEYDEDGDGFPNAVEFAAGSLPAAIGSQPPFTITRANGLARFSMPLLRSGVSLSVEKSIDLNAWTDDGITNLSASTPDAFTVEAAAGSDGPLFFRVRAGLTTVSPSAQ